ncbi:F-box/WD repeat-containing protein 7, partial [Symbiodinium microadriaticum]
VWDLEDGRCLATLTGHRSYVRAVACLTASTVVSGSSDRTARLWDAAAGHCLAIFEGHSDSVTCLAAFEDQLATGSDDTTIK